MASLQSTPSRKLLYEQHILATQQSRTPPRYNSKHAPAAAATLKPQQIHSDSSDSGPSTSSDPPKSFLALDADSSPTTTQGADSSPMSTSASHHPTARRAASTMNNANLVNTIRSRFEADSSPKTKGSPASASLSSGADPNRLKGSSYDSREAGPSRLDAITNPPSISRGSRLGAQMERTRSEQTSIMNREETSAISSSLTSPIRKGDNIVGKGKPASMQTQSPNTRAPTDAFLASPEARRNGAVGTSSSSTTQVHQNGKARNPSLKGSDIPSTSIPQSALARRIEAENLQAALHSNDYTSNQVSSIQQSNMQAQDPASSQGEIHSPTASSSSVTSPDRSSSGGHVIGPGPRVGKLSRLQYSKVDPVARQSGPSWDMSAASSRIASLSSRPNLMGRVSNPNMLSDFRRGEQQGTEASRVNLSVDETTAQQNQGGLDAMNRAAERRELMLPALNGMRSAVESVLSTETFIRKEERRRSATAYHQSSSSEDRVVNGQSSQATSPREAALAEQWHRRTPSLEASTMSPGTVAETWQRVSEAPRHDDTEDRPKYPLSSSPMSSSKATAREAAVIAKDSSAKVGQLSDEAIVRLGAVPGIDPFSLLNTNGQPLSSKNILTIALQKAQSAVLLDSANNVPDAILAYRQAVRLLLEVMERVSPKNTLGSRRKSSREEERRRLKVIHDTYADRIRLLSMINAPDDEVGDSSIGEDSFSRQSPTPVRTKKSNDSVLLNGLGIKDSKGWTQSTPQIAIAVSDVDLSASQNGNAVRQDDDREARLDVFTSKADRHSSLNGSDSEVSFRSAKDPAFASVYDRHRRSRSRNSAGDEIISLPLTPYFDTDSGLTGTELTLVDPQEGRADDGLKSTSILATVRPVSPEERRKRSSQDRTSRGLSSLDNVPSAADIAASNGQSSRRFLSIGSQALFQKEISISSPLRNRIDDGQDSAVDKSASGKSAVFGNRPRALTLGVNEQGRMLVSATTSSGMISQRRKMAGAGLGVGSGPKIGDDDIFRSEGTSSLDSTAVRYGSGGDGINATTKVAVSSEEDLDMSSDVKFTSGRKRATSQPSNRRPSIPASFKTLLQPQSSSSQGPPPVPKIKRKASMPLSPLVFQQQQQGTIKATSNGNSAFRFPSPTSSATSGYHALGTPSAVMGQYPWCNSNSTEAMSSITSDLFPASLPSQQMGAVPSYASNSYPVHLPWIGVTSSLPDSASLMLPPANKMMRPFYVMNLLQASIERGSYITKRLYLSRELWLQSGSRLLAIETKVRMLDSISNGIEGIERAGSFLLRPSHTDQPGLNAINASKFLKLLEDFETLLIEVQNTLAKKLGFLETVDGKKSSNSFVSLGSKLTRSLDRMTANSKSNIDTPANYIDGLSRLFTKAQVIGEHLRTLNRSKRELDSISPTKESEWDSISIEIYATLPAELKRSIEFKLKRASEFFTSVILRFVLRDVAILVDKSVKRNTVLLTE